MEWVWFIWAGLVWVNQLHPPQLSWEADLKKKIIQLRVCPPQKNGIQTSISQGENSAWTVVLARLSEGLHQSGGCGLFCTVSAFKSLHILINLRYILEHLEQITALTTNAHKKKVPENRFQGIEHVRLPHTSHSLHPKGFNVDFDKSVVL